MITAEEIQKLYDVAKVEEQELDLKRQVFRGKSAEAEHQAKMLEFMIKNLDINALIAVHITDHFPNNGRIQPAGHFLTNLYIKHKAGRVIEDAGLSNPRITIHFTLNYAVKGVVAHGRWIKWEGKYVILIPLKDIINRIVCLNPIDTWSIGSIKLPESAEILVPQHEYSKKYTMLKEHAGKASILPFSDELKPAEAAEQRIKVKRYRVTTGGDHGWFENESSLGTLPTFLKRSDFLTEDEREHILRHCMTKGYTSWTQVFVDIAEKYRKKVLKHDRTEWRRLEEFFEEILGFIFEPHPDERNLTSHQALRRIHGHAKTAKTYKTAMRHLVEEDVYPADEEKESLKKLEEGLNNLENFLMGIYKRNESVQESTWEQILQKEKIL